MKANVGAMDRMIRIMIGIVFIYLTIFPTTVLSNEILRVFVGIFGIGNFMVGLVRFCPLYIFTDINTNRPARKDDTTA